MQVNTLRQCDDVTTMDDVAPPIEQFILEAWDSGMTGDEVINYVCYMSSRPRFEVEDVLNNLIRRMSE